MTSNERIRELREQLKISQTEFANRLGSGRGIIKNIEEGRTVPKPQWLDLVAQVFDVNRVWLETGDGEMFIQKTRDDKIAAFVGEALADNDDDFKRAVLELLADLDAEDWQALKTIAKKINAINKKESREE